MQKPIKEVSIWGGLITECIVKMKTAAQQGNFIAKQELNGAIVLVEGNSDVNLIFRDQQRAQSGYIRPLSKPQLKVM